LGRERALSAPDPFSLPQPAIEIWRNVAVLVERGGQPRFFMAGDWDKKTVSRIVFINAGR
jgi:hypothetical protein